MELTLCNEDGRHSLGEITLTNRPTSESKRLVFVSAHLADKNGGNIIYANGAAEAEKIALQLYDIVDSKDILNESIQNLIDLVKKTIHAQYRLASVLKKGIAFHYGNMPLIIRQQIETLFKNGDIKFLVCTSTLLEGVNLPAKSIFVRRPTRGRNKPLNQTDFWNLAGRAGRWGKEFDGNVICIEPQTWVIPPDVKKNKHVIEPAIKKVIDKIDSLKAYIVNNTPRSLANKNQDFEYAFGYFYTKFLKGQLSDNPIINSELKPLFVELQNKFTLPDYILLKNPGISPIAQQALYDYFIVKDGTIESYIPLFPESENAVSESYVRIVGVTSKVLSGDSELRNYYLAILVVNWMKGYPLSVLIQQSQKYWKSKKNIHLVIREVMKDVEEYARFKFAKYSSCYIDVLRYYLTNSDRHDLSSTIPQLNMWLEFGVSQQTQISLISLGLSRNTSIALSEYIASDNLNRADCLAWISENDISLLEISPIMIEEILNIKKSKTH